MKSQQPPTTQNRFTMYRKVVVGIAIAIAAIASVYLVYFRHGAPEDIMAANMARRSHPKTGGGRARAEYDYYDYEDEEDEKDEEMTAKSTKKKWDRWIFKNNYVSIGELYNKCGKLSVFPPAVNTLCLADIH